MQLLPIQTCFLCGSESVEVGFYRLEFSGCFQINSKLFYQNSLRRSGCSCLKWSVCVVGLWERRSFVGPSSAEVVVFDGEAVRRRSSLPFCSLSTATLHKEPHLVRLLWELLVSEAPVTPRHPGVLFYHGSSCLCAAKYCLATGQQSSPRPPRARRTALVTFEAADRQRLHGGSREIP